jgi:hypothetical protein
MVGYPTGKPYDCRNCLFTVGMPVQRQRIVKLAYRVNSLLALQAANIAGGVNRSGLAHAAGSNA